MMYRWLKKTWHLFSFFQTLIFVWSLVSSPKLILIQHVVFSLVYLFKPYKTHFLQVLDCLEGNNSTFLPCIWLLRGFCLELYPYCLFRGHGNSFWKYTNWFVFLWSKSSNSILSSPDFSAKGMVRSLCGAPKTTSDAASERLFKISIKWFWIEILYWHLGRKYLLKVSIFCEHIFSNNIHPLDSGDENVFFFLYGSIWINMLPVLPVMEQLAGDLLMVSTFVATCDNSLHVILTRNTINNYNTKIWYYQYLPKITAHLTRKINYFIHSIGDDAGRCRYLFFLSLTQGQIK